MGRYVYSSSYSPVGDLMVISICLVMIILMLFSYNRRSKSFGIFLSEIGFVMLAAYSDVVFHLLAPTAQPERIPLLNGIRCAYHAFLFLIFVLFVVYIAEVTRLDRGRKRLFAGLAMAVFLTVVAVDIADTLRGLSLRRTDDGIVFQGRGIFMYGYAAFVAIIVVMLVHVRKRLYRRVMLGFYGTMIVSFTMLLLQGMKGQSSFTVATFLYPVIAMFYIMHSTPYDATLGAIDSSALEDMVKYSYDRRRDFIFMSLYMRTFDEEGKRLPEALQATIRRFSTDFFNGATLFQVGKGHMILVFWKSRNVDYEQRIQSILSAFNDEYRRFQYDYKIVIGHSIPEVSRKNEYVSFIRNIHRTMPENTIRRIEPGDVKRFNSNEYVLRALEDIYKKRDLDDPRVLAYCQPVYNIKTGKYDTAEALMRLELEETGMVFPDQFIPLAEENGYIHILTEIILNKTCQAIRQLTEAGYAVSRISVNVSVLELKDERFCDDIIRIIKKNGIAGEKIAIELTESKNDSDFILMKEKISELRKLGIKFYLDDFGTGYSNMERIMELPFDIIKFDRSMVIASGESERSKRIVVSLANLLSEMDYSVLFEGVEKEADEQMCIGMSASYLQGYKYSKPVPIETLTAYFER
ncbi:MAG: EAL domain-containing protein [Clostridia bacterium]|nr:EAL domain-containing protein [Clostridia bacterium]